MNWAQGADPGSDTRGWPSTPDFIRSLAVEIAGDDLYFQTVARVGQTVDSGVIQRVAQSAGGASWPTVGTGHNGLHAQTVAKVVGAGLTSGPTATEWNFTTTPSAIFFLTKADFPQRVWKDAGQTEGGGCDFGKAETPTLPVLR